MVADLTISSSCFGCQVLCQQDGRPLLRCGNCRMAWYCSVHCQRQDWKVRHRRICRHGKEPRQSMPSENVRQLSSPSSLSPPPRVQIAQNELSSMGAASDLVRCRISTKVSTVRTEDSNCRSWNYFMEDMTHLSCYQILIRPVNCNTKVSSECVRISMQNGGTSLRPESSIAIYYQGEDDRENSTLCIQLNRKLVQDVQPRLYETDGNRSLSIRLSYESSSYEDSGFWPNPILVDPIAASRGLACAYCHQFLLRTQQHESNTNVDDNDNSLTDPATSLRIERVLPLPSGRWDEMQDYLVCYEGQASVDFGSASTKAQRGALLEDATVLVAHKDDVNDSVCVLSVPGYGTNSSHITTDNNNSTTRDNVLNGKDFTALVRGNRQWRDAVGGASVTCSCCATCLGFAPIEIHDTYRLLKHRVVILNPQHSSNALPPGKFQQHQTISSFVAREMVRYAETKAVFIFSIVCDEERTITNGAKSNSFSRHRSRVLSLRLVSWDSIFAEGTSTEVLDADNHGLSRVVPHWSKRCKILYEEMDDIAILNGKNEDDTIWTWTRNDWCCPSPTNLTPTTASESRSDEIVGSTSSVELFLSKSEWLRLYRELKQSSQFFSREVVEATIRATSGRASTPSNSIGLASVPC